MNRILFILAATMMSGALVAGCASSKRSPAARQLPPPSTPSTVPSPSTLDLTGTWNGHGGSQGSEMLLAARIVQSGNTLEGDLYAAGRGDLSGPIKGTVDGNVVQLTLGSGLRQSSALQISADGNQITGNVVGSPLVLNRTK
jgi:hypothetical protein